MGESRLAAKLLSLDGRAEERIVTLWEPGEEILGRQLVERWLGALGEQLGQPLDLQAALDFDIEHAALSRTLDRQSIPAVAVDPGVDAEVAIGMVEFEEDVGFAVRRLFLCAARGGFLGVGPASHGDCQHHHGKPCWRTEKPVHGLVSGSIRHRSIHKQYPSP